MNEYVVLSDVAGDLTEELARRIGIDLLPMGFEMDGQAYKHYSDAREMSLDEFYQRLSNGSMPKTSQINPLEYEEFFEPYLKAGKDLLYVSFTSGLSSSYQSSCAAVGKLGEKYPDRKIYSVDSLCASIGQGYLLIDIMKKKPEMTIEELREYVIGTRKKVAHWFMVDDLFHLKRGGRVSTASAVFGSALNIKPVLTLDDEGRLAVHGKVRGTNKGLSYIEGRLDEEGLDTANQRVMIGHVQNLELAQSFKKSLMDAGKIKDADIVEIGPIIGTHVGSGFIALVFMKG